MKKILLLFIALVTSLVLYVTVNASTWQFVWSNTLVKIPVGSPLYDYSKVPYATLYKDGVMLDDAFVTYNRDGDWLYYLKDVNTQKIGEYKVWYKAFEYDKYKPGTCNGYKALITFVVYDNEKPSIDIVSEELDIEKMSIDENSLDSYLKENVVVSDNYSKNVDVTLQHNVDINNIGKYKVIVSATDEAKNKNTAEFYVNVFYNQYPILTCKNPDNVISLELNSNVDISECFYASDKIDGDLTNSIKYLPIDTSIVSSYKLEVSVTNSAGYLTSIDVTINVIDDISPKISLKYESINLDYETDLETFDFSFYADIEDDNEINYDNLEIVSNIENKVGVYDVIYTYSDGYNKTSKTMTVKMLSYKSPQIIVEDIKFKKNTNVDLSKYISLYDESDPNVKETLVIDDSNVDYTSNGTYYATASCNNSSGLQAKKTFRVIIEDDIINSSSMPFIITLVVIVSFLVVSLIAFLVFIIIKKRKKNIASKSKII